MGQGNRHTSFGLIAAAALATAACSGSGAPVVKTISWQQGPGTETVTCYTFKLDNETALEVGHIQMEFGDGSHHVHIYRADVDMPDNTDSCPNGIDWNTWHMLVGAQTKPVDWELPTGVTLPVKPYQQLLIQVHWLNTTATANNYDVKLTLTPVSLSTAHMGVVFGVNKNVVMPPQTYLTADQWCGVPGQNLLAIMGHFHSRGISYQVTQRTESDPAGADIYDALGEQTLEFKVYSPTLTLAADDGLDFRCDFFNNTDQLITWGPNTVTQEHCNMAAYFYPAPEQELPICLSGAPGVATLEPESLQLIAGQPGQLTVHLNSPAPTGGALVTLSSPEVNVLDFPPTLLVPEGLSSTSFAVTGLRPSHPVSLRADMGSSHSETIVTVGGLVLSEVPNTDPSSQWIQIQNVSPVSVDLSQFSLGIAGNTFADDVVGLDFTIPAAGCAVVGTLSGAMQPAAFAPPLTWASTSSQGVALFDLPSAQVTAQTTPVDSVVWGVTSPNLPAPSGVPQSAVATVPSGWTLRRQDMNSWVADPAPTPTVCQVQP